MALVFLSCMLASSVSEAPQTLLKFAVISDMNKSYGSTTYSSELDKAIEFIKRADVDVVLSTGDMVAGQRKGLNYGAMWESFHQHVTQPLAQSKIPFAPSPGNHDASNAGPFSAERQAYQQAFSGKVPAALVPGSQFPFYYYQKYNLPIIGSHPLLLHLAHL